MTDTMDDIHIEEIVPNGVGANGLSNGEMDDDDDYSGMPELCDNDAVISEKKKAALPTDTKSSASAEKIVPRESLVGTWEDLLGSGRVKKKIVKLGNGLAPERGARVTVAFQERLEEDGPVVGEDEELTFNVGESEVIQALDLVIPLMEVEEEAVIEAVSDFCYGTTGDGERVPSGATIFLTVRIKECVEIAAPPDLPIDERHAIGNQKRLRGNKWYSRGDYSQAVQCYRKAVEYLDDESVDAELEAPIDRFMLPKNLQSMLEDRVKAYNNMAQAQMKLKAWDSAFSSVRQVLKIEPNNEKALFRKAKILQEKYRTEEAIGILRRVTRLFPDNKSAQAELSQMLEKQRKGKIKEQALSRKMLGLPEDDPSKNQDKLSSSRTKLVLACLGGLGALLAAAIAKHNDMI